MRRSASTLASVSRLILSAIGGASLGAIGMMVALLMTHLFVAVMRGGRGFLPEVSPLVVPGLGLQLHVLSLTAILGAVLGSGYVLWKAFEPRQPRS